MIKETKNIEFYTTGKQTKERDFTRISQWIKKDKIRKGTKPSKKQTVKQKDLA